MLGAFLTTLFFSLSSICANRAVRIVGPTRANGVRLLIAFGCLGLWAQAIPLLTKGRFGGSGFSSAGLGFMLASGVVGMGLCDLAVYAALPYLGSRLTVVMTQCLAAPIAAFAEWLWLGTTLTIGQIFAGLVVLAGVALAILPSKQSPPRVQVRPAGILFGSLSAVGQGLGAVLSRRAYAAVNAAGQHLDGMTATYQRIVGGLAITLVFFAFQSWLSHDQTEKPISALRGFARWKWTVLNALAGAVVGVSCYQWALATTPSGIVLPIVATTPLVIVPLAYVIDGERPTVRSLLGGIVAVAGAVALSRARA
jgi:drug/metabolite transporter (DMT)-like permease